VVVESPDRWRLHVPGAEVVAARDYLTEPRFADLRRARVYNLCRTYGYQRTGYYVSLLAAARGHRPLPSVETIQDLRISPVVRIASEELEERIQRALAPLRSDRFQLSVYFGRNVTRRYDALAAALFDQFPAPLLRATFVREDDWWSLASVRLIATNDVPDSHREFVEQRAREYLARPRRRAPRRTFRYDLAILVDPDEPQPPSDERALKRFARAAEELSVAATLVERCDYHRVAEFDGLFIRETTSVAHHTYRWARRAAAEGLAVIDHPESIVRCTNKVFQAELFRRHGIPFPRTEIVHERNVEAVARTLGFPCVLKLPDGSFSRGVVKVGSADEMRERARDMLGVSDLLIAQPFVPSAFDWRIGVLDGRPLYAARYHMAPGHWQIVGPGGRRGTRYGKVEAVAVEDAPPRAVAAAAAAARHMGDGLYGVDVKPVDGRFLVMEVNDNPNLEAGCEDAVLGDALYLAIMRWFHDRFERRGREAADR